MLEDYNLMASLMIIAHRFVGEDPIAVVVLEGWTYIESILCSEVP